MQGPTHELPGKLKAAPIPEVVNHTAWPAQYFQHVDPRAEGFHVMVCRTSYTLERLSINEGGLLVPELLEPQEQLPLCRADEFMGIPNASSLLQESDFAPYKPKCDVLLIHATAYSPQGQPAQRWQAGFKFGTAIQKQFEVTGPLKRQEPVDANTNVNANTLTRKRAVEIEAVTQVTLGYEQAFGGPNLITKRQWVESLAAQEKSVVSSAEVLLGQWPKACEANPIGCGLRTQEAMQVQEAVAQLATAKGHGPTPEQLTAAQQLLDRTPQVQALNQPYSGQEDYPVIGVGPLGRWWQPRVQLAGTHDEKWKSTQWPKSPLDHNYGYWNSAPQDQQIAFPQGGEEIELLNLTPGAGQNGGAVRLMLPEQDLQLLVRLKVGAVMFAPMNIDTVIIDFKAKRLSVVRRAVVSARTDVRRLELGTWAKGTAMEVGASPAAEVADNAATNPTAKP